MAREKLSKKDELRLEYLRLKQEPKKQIKRKALSTFFKDPEESIAEHIGKLVDRLEFNDVLALCLGVWGYLHTQRPEGFGLGLLGWKLATSRNNYSGLAGLGMLGFTGLVGIPKDELNKLVYFDPKTGKTKPFIEVPEAFVIG